MGGVPVKRLPVLMLVGPSQIGKDTLIERLCREHAYTYHMNATTRLPRPENKGIEEYQFLTRDAFRWRIRHNGFVDWDYYAGNYYGVIPPTVYGHPSVMHCGARMSVRIMARNPKFLAVFLRPSDINRHTKRIRAKFPSDEAQARITMMNEEIDHLPLFDTVLEIASYASTDNILEEVVALHARSRRDD